MEYCVCWRCGGPHPLFPSPERRRGCMSAPRGSAGSRRRTAGSGYWSRPATGQGGSSSRTPGAARGGDWPPPLTTEGWVCWRGGGPHPLSPSPERRREGTSAPGGSAGSRPRRAGSGCRSRSATGQGGSSSRTPCAARGGYWPPPSTMECWVCSRCGGPHPMPPLLSAGEAARGRAAARLDARLRWLAAPEGRR